MSVSMIEALLLIVLIHTQVLLNCQKDHISARSVVFFDSFAVTLFYLNTCFFFQHLPFFFIDPKNKRHNAVLPFYSFIIVTYS